MYRHLLVPVDDTDLSIEVVGNAVALARTIGARITFFHAVADAARSLRGDAEVLRADRARRIRVRLSRQGARAAGQGRGRGARARRAVRVAPCVSDRPAQAIVEAARAGGCDLIFMASHGHHGKLGMALRVRDAGGADERRAAGAGVVDRRACGTGAGDRHHPRRASFAGGGDARVDACPGRRARGRHRPPIRR